MASRTAIIAALPREVAKLVKGTRPDPGFAGKGVMLYQMSRARVVAAGMGAGRVALAFEAATLGGEIEEVISVGLAGACRPELRPGQAIEAGRVIDAQTGERYSTVSPQEEPVLISVDAVASVREKARLASAYGAALVDMEAATVARLARAHGLRFRAVKGISDAHDFEIEGLGAFTGKQGQFRTAAFAVHTALRPRTWAAAWTLGRESQRALDSMGDLLQRIMQTEA